MKTPLTLAALGAIALLAACGSDEGRGGLSAEEESQLDNAAKMLDENMVDASPDSMVANEADLEAMEAPENSGAEVAVENAQ